MTIFKVLDASTAHLTEKTQRDIDNWASMTGEWGFLMNTTWVEDEDDVCPVPEDLMTVLKHAQVLECDFVLFDHDSDKLEGVPIYG